MPEDLLPPSPQPRVFRLTQQGGLQTQTTLWGSAHEAPASFSHCHSGIARALAGQQETELTWWSGALDRHLDQLVAGYMDGCRTAQRWDLSELVRVHWYAWAVKLRLRGSRFFPTLWKGAGPTLAALRHIHS